MDGKLRLNGAAFWQKWDDFQFSRLDTSISPITLTYNVGNAESNGFEFDFTAMLAAASMAVKSNSKPLLSALPTL